VWQIATALLLCMRSRDVAKRNQKDHYLPYTLNFL